jgi:hypothetical protein
MAEENKQNKLWLKIFIGLFYLFVFFVLLKNSFGYLDPDFGWHLKTGELIYQTRAVPDLNYEDYTLEGKTWVDHEWLMNLVTYAIYHNFGYIAVNVFFALLIIAVLLIQLWFAGKLFLRDNRGLFLFLALQLFGLWAALPHFGVRMQEITIFCLLLLTIIIFFYNQNKNYRILFWLPLLFLFWASAHAGFLIGLFILGLFAAVKLFELVTARKFYWKFIDYEKVLSLKQTGIFAVFSLLALLATFATPYGLRLYGFLGDYRNAYYQTHISEWLGQYFFPFRYPQLFYLEIVFLFFTLLFFAVFIFKGERRRKINLWDFSLVALFAFLSFKARRHFPLLFIVSLPVISAWFAGFLNFDFLVAKGGFKKNTVKKNFAGLFFAITIFLSVQAAIKTDFISSPEVFFRDSYPYEAVKFLRAHPEWNNRRIFNEYGWGGYLIWQYPERKLFIDGRLPQYPLNGKTMLEEYFSFFDKEKTAGQLKEYDIGLAFLKIKEETSKIHWWEKAFFGISEEKLAEAQKEGFALRDYLRGSSEWQSAYNDGLAEIFIKKIIR